MEPGLEPFFDADGDLDPDLEPFLELGGDGVRLLVPFFDAGGEGERSFLLSWTLESLKIRTTTSDVWPNLLNVSQNMNQKEKLRMSY